MQSIASYTTLYCGALQGVEFWAVNTDAQALENSLAMNKVQLGSELTRGLGEAQLLLLMLAPWPSNDIHCILSSQQPFCYQLSQSRFGVAGTGGNPELGEQAAQESLEALGASVGNADMASVVHLLVCLLPEAAH